MDFHFASRMDQFQPGIFNVLDEKKKDLEAAGKKVWNLSIGTPDFQPEPHVIEAMIQAARDPENWKYALTETPELVKAVQNWYRRRYGVALARDEMMSVYGSQEGLAHVGWALCDPGDAGSFRGNDCILRLAAGERLSAGSGAFLPGACEAGQGHGGVLSLKSRLRRSAPVVL